MNNSTDDINNDSINNLNDTEKAKCYKNENSYKNEYFNYNNNNEG